ncbi:sulfite exporter TauE/SafE family protein [Candidatus Peregrinibacteria bacterium]|nr:sulfite exporter TauE/SafE family protein [Candidatus Peregrinibacteria bacterium]
MTHKINKLTLPIKGMHCRSCEMLIEDELKDIPNVKSVQVSLKDKQAEIITNHAVDPELFRAAVEKAGYTVGIDDKQNWFSKDPYEYMDLGIALIVLLAIYFFAKAMGLTSINIGSSGGAPRSLPVVFVVGLTAGVSTCMALVGGLVLGIAARHAEKHPEATPFQNFRPHIYFNIGRILSYFVLGGLIGLIGKALELSSLALGIMTLGVGVVMLVLGLQLTQISPRISAISLTIPSGISKFFGIRKHHDKEYSHANSMLVGGLTFFLPCGFTQAMQLYAMSTGSFLSGALIMSVFALGTAPGLLGIGGLTASIRGSFAQSFFKFSGLVVIFLSLFNITNGYRLTGWDFLTLPPSTPIVAAQDPNVVLENGVQVVRMAQTAYGYKPNTFTIKKGIPVKWIVDGQDSYSCSSSLVVPKIGVRKNLSAGENVIEFTPQEVGPLKFTCSMGMYPGTFNVVDDSSPTAPQAAAPVAQPVQVAAAGGSCGGSGGGCGGCGGGFRPKAPVVGTTENVAPEVQVIRTAYLSSQEDIVPNNFTVQVGKPVRFEVEVKENGSGCMSTVMVPGLADTPQFLSEGKTLVFEFTPTEKGSFDITCAMGVPRGTIRVT